MTHGRLSLISGYPITESDVVGSINLYYLPVAGPSVSVFDGTSIASLPIGSQLVLPLDNNPSHSGYHQVGKIFDVFAISVSGVPILGTGPAWASDTGRSSDIERLSWLNVNKTIIGIRTGNAYCDIVSVPVHQATYLGSFRATANGQASSTKTQRLLYNACNGMITPFSVEGGAASYPYSGTAWQSLANAMLKAEFLLGLSGVAVHATATAIVINSTATGRIVRAGIGLDSFTSPALHALTPTVTVANALAGMVSHYEDFPGLGYHFIAPIEMGAGTDTQTWCPFGPGNYRSGLKGSFIA